MKTLTITFCIKVFVIIYVLTDSLPVIAGRRRGRKKDHSIGDMDNSIVEESYFGHYRSNNFDDEDVDDVDNNYNADELLNFSTNDQEVEKVRRKRIDPKGSWLTFVNRLGENAPERRKNKRKRNRKVNNKILLGPAGPVGPPGPPGPPGSSITKEEIIKDLEILIKEEAERRAQQMLADMIPANTTYIPQPEMTSHFLAVPKIYSGFSMRLGSKTRVRRKTLMEIKSFQQPFGGGAFQRGATFNAREGRFVAPRDGVYQFTANLHLRIRTHRRLTSRSKPDEHLKVVICIDSLCRTNTSIETITGVNIDNKLLTASVSGLLLLKEKQYASLYVDNSSSYNVLVTVGSEYSGIFLGA